MLFVINGKLVANNDRSEAFPPRRRSRKTAINHVLDLENRFNRFRGVAIARMTKKSLNVWRELMNWSLWDDKFVIGYHVEPLLMSRRFAIALSNLTISSRHLKVHERVSHLRGSCSAAEFLRSRDIFSSSYWLSITHEGNYHAFAERFSLNRSWRRTWAKFLMLAPRTLRQSAKSFN